ncbi:MAG: sulfatase-like hydrolase/transferase [Planctomycetes bacterium]|nr:sulfatase-like hydrolase/transferase [Planctomycetota bacterium]
MSRLRLAALLALAACAAAPASRTAVAPPRPLNVLLLVSDDQRVDSLGAFGNADAHTPQLDRLVDEGFAMTGVHCMGAMTGAVCGPSRFMLLSGRQLFSLTNAHPSPAASFPSLPAKFREAGYQTFATGKWHNGPAWFNAAFEDGASIFFGGMGSHTELPVHAYDPTGRYPAEHARPLRAFSSTEFADALIDFLDRRDAGRPFFAYVAFTAPHDPRTPPAEHRARFDPATLALPANFLPQHPFDNGELRVRDERLAPWPRTPAVVREHLADYYGMVSQLDEQVGRILAALDAHGLTGDTLVVFTSDHGLALGSHGLLGKQNLYEHSMGAPLVVRGPGVRRGRSAALAYLLDLPATLAELTGVEPPEGQDGESFAPLLRGERDTARRELVTAYCDVQRALRDERWKLIRYPQVDRTQLFDLARDPDEVHDLAADPAYAERTATMLARLAELQRELGDGAPLRVAAPSPAAVDLSAE